MTAKTIKVYVYPQLLSAFYRNEVTNVVRVLRGTIDINKVHSKIGYKGDSWVIAEHGQLHKKHIFQRTDGTAVMKTYTGETVNVITPWDNDEGENIPAEEMPKWAARHQYEVVDVSFPVKLDNLNETQIHNMGVVEKPANGSIRNYIWGDIQVPCRTGIKDAFVRLWDMTYNKNRECSFGKNIYVTVYSIAKK